MVAGHLRHAVVGLRQRQPDPPRRAVAVAAQLVVDHGVGALAGPHGALGPGLEVGRVGGIDDELDRVAEGRDRRVGVDRQLADGDRSVRGTGLDPDRPDGAVGGAAPGRAAGEPGERAEGRAVGGDLERAGPDRVAAVGPAGDRGDRPEADRPVEDEREMIVGAGRLVGFEE